MKLSAMSEGCCSQTAGVEAPEAGQGTSAETCGRETLKVGPCVAAESAPVKCTAAETCG